MGSDVTRLAVGDWAVPMPAAGFGTWRNVAKADVVRAVVVSLCSSECGGMQFVSLS